MISELAVYDSILVKKEGWIESLNHKTEKYQSFKIRSDAQVKTMVGWRAHRHNDTHDFWRAPM